MDITGSRSQIAIVAKQSFELKLALAAVRELDIELCLFTRPVEAAEALCASGGPVPSARLGAVIIVIGDSDPEAADLIARLRDDADLSHVPIVLAGQAQAHDELKLRDGLAVNSQVVTESIPGTVASLLARTIQYWATINRVPGSFARQPAVRREL